MSKARGQTGQRAATRRRFDQAGDVISRVSPRLSQAIRSAIKGRSARRLYRVMIEIECAGLALMWPQTLRRRLISAGLDDPANGDDSAPLSSAAAFDAAHYVAHAKGLLSLVPSDVAIRRGWAAYHYLRIGARLAGRRPNALFDPSTYLKTYPDIAVAGYEPFAYARTLGRFEGRGIDALVPPHDTADGPDVGLDDVFASPVRDRERGLGRTVDVILPAYRGRSDTLRAIKSVLAAPDAGRFDLIVIDDASPEPELSHDLTQLAAAGRLTLLRNPQNQGFVASVNRGLAVHPDRDVILLNADAEVFSDGLSRILSHMEKADDVATVTPMSNAATILSYPIPLHDNQVRLEVPWSTIDQLFRQAAAHCAAPDVVTGVGFCMAMRRRTIDDVGAFDEQAFAKGYGEENDFCLRAAKRGWRNVAACDTFVWHRGGGSFGGEREARVAKAQKTLAKRHPDYHRDVRQFMRRDPFRWLREEVDCARLRAMGVQTLRIGSSRHDIGNLGPSGPGPDDAAARMPTLWLVPDLAPYADSLRVVAPSAGGVFPNLPRLGPHAPATRDQAKDLLARLRVGKLLHDKSTCALGHSHATSQRVIEAAQAMAVDVRVTGQAS